MRYRNGFGVVRYGITALVPCVSSIENTRQQFAGFASHAPPKVIRFMRARSGSRPPCDFPSFSIWERFDFQGDGAGILALGEVNLMNAVEQFLDTRAVGGGPRYRVSV